MTIDRRAVVGRHDIHLTAADPGVVLSLGNGDFGFTADATGLQTFTAHHTPVLERGPGMTDPRGRRVAETCTMSSWGWHEGPNPEGYVLDDAMTPYESRRGPVRYPDRPSMKALMGGQTPERADLAGMWLVGNPHRLDLGRLGIEFRPTPDAEPETDPAVLSDLDVRLDLWTGVLTSSFTYLDEQVEVATVVHGSAGIVATRVTSALLTTGQLTLRLAFPGPNAGFTPATNWADVDSHATELVLQGPGRAVVHRTLDGTRYDVDLSTSDGEFRQAGTHVVVLDTDASSAEVVASFTPVAGPGSHLVEGSSTGGGSRHARSFLAGYSTSEGDRLVGYSANGESRLAGNSTGKGGSTNGGLGFNEIAESSASSWEEFWTSGAALDLAGSTDPLASELERRVVLSQYLTRVHGGGLMPPQETGFVTNSWAGKSHLEMHWWHAAHFPAWGRPELLERSLEWYESIHASACATAAAQGYAGARWPKQVGPDGRESPSDIGSLLVWQQPHLLHFAELLHAALPEGRRAALAERLAPLVEDTAAFMADFADDVDGVFHLGPPVMPAQEFYTAAETQDPTFELAYWWYGLELAQRFRERRGLTRDEGWTRVQAGLVPPSVTDGHYAAVGGAGITRADDHPSMLQALGFLPPTPHIDAATMRRTLDWVLGNWDWDSAWGWDYPVMAMTATRLGDARAAVGTLLRDAIKNRYDAVGHNPAMGSFLPLYLPANGGLLAAVSLMVGGWEGGPELPGIPDDGTWQIAHEGFVPWPN